MKFMKPYLRKAAVAAFSLFAAALLMVILQTCDSSSTDPEPKPDPTPVSPDDPLPETPCKMHVIDGYTGKVSYDAAEPVTVFIKSDKKVDLCKLTIYTVNGDEAFSIPSPMIEQTVSANDPSVNGFGYMPTVNFSLPENIRSGVYLVEKKIPFIVKTKAATDLVVVYASNTANAYCESGGRDLYSANNKPFQVSFQRPIPLDVFSPACLGWLQKLEGFTMSYIADSDLDDWESISGAKIIVLVGHNEYWTREARVNFDRFVDSGGDALILSGNTMWWQVRYAENRTKLLCFKELPDPINDLLAQTKNWDNPQLHYPILSSIGADFPHGGYGLKSDAGWDGFKIYNPGSPLLEGTGLAKGDVLSCPSTEMDGAPIASFDEQGYLVIDTDKLGFEKVELIGFDKGYRVWETYGTFIVLQKTASSGIIVNTSTCDWCSARGMGGKDAEKIKKITLNALKKLKNHEKVFTE